MKLGYEVYGASVQSTEYQKEFVCRMHITFPILSDHYFALTDTLNLPTFVFDEMRLTKRLALVIEDQVIKKVFYPAFPPNENAAVVLKWLVENTNVSFRGKI